MATFGSFFHQGQICLNTREIIVQRGIYEEFLTKYVERTKTLPSGDPLDPRTIIGPLVHQGAVDLMDERVREAVSLGATLRTGGTHEGLVYQPTILTDVPFAATAAHEETFGPLVVVDAVDTPEEAVAVANRVQYGLTSTILAGDTYRAFELAPTDGRCARQRLGSNGPRQPRRLHRPHLDQHDQQQTRIPVLVRPRNAVARLTTTATWPSLVVFTGSCSVLYRRHPPPHIARFFLGRHE
jgi:hypothetical protein